MWGEVTILHYCPRCNSILGRKRREGRGKEERGADFYDRLASYLEL